ncbi:hypothetical protein ES692_16005 [Psychroserpens burtonensis]|uniref:Rhamnosyl transferase n=1 Tax=Psychroserpens burtonensis TaxID=49278 RepID=A0A5C7B3T0_9FLAO|nr:glycosyltransferase [Psychroserpens burtonensis]TXE15601.1 hypothetical protein ES692_16005 [Psychroserpens burtonensis]
MEHYLITRFNLKNENWHNPNSDNHVLSNTWLDERFNIFETYCLPSIENQTNKNFKWLVCFDIDTPKDYSSKIKNLEIHLPFFQPLFIDGFKNLEKDISNFVKADSQNRFIITTRLDNDDIVHKNFIKTIQNLFQPKSAVININLGYQLILMPNKNYQLRLVKKEHNPFMSVISEKDNFESVLSKEHHYWKSHNHQIINKNERLWIQFVHGNNVLNDISKTSKKTTNFKMDDFGLKNIEIDERDIDVVFYNIKTLPNRLFKNVKLILKTLINK